MCSSDLAKLVAKSLLSRQQQLDEPTEPTRKRRRRNNAGSKAKKAKTAAATEPARCGVCIAAVDEIFKELAVTENSTSTLDLRWGLTAQVTDGRAKRIGKVIKYNRSQLRAIEVMEKICGEMKQYERYAAVAGEVQLKSRAEIKRLNPGKTSSNPDEEKEEKKRDTSRFERYCEELTEKQEEKGDVRYRGDASSEPTEATPC